MTRALRQTQLRERWASSSYRIDQRNQWGESIDDPTSMIQYDIDFFATSKPLFDQRDPMAEGMRRSGSRVVWIHQAYTDHFHAFEPGLKLLRRRTGRCYTIIDIEEWPSYYRCMCEAVHQIESTQDQISGVTYLQGLNRAVRLAVAEGTELSSSSVIPSHDSSDFAPNETYATVNFLRARRVGHPWYHEEPRVSEKGDTIYHQYTFTQLEIVIRCECYGPTAYDRLLLLAQWWASPKGLLFLPVVTAAQTGWKGNIQLGHIASGPVQRLDALVSSEWESRAAQDVTLGTIATMIQTEEVGVLDDDWTIWVEE